MILKDYASGSIKSRFHRLSHSDSLSSLSCSLRSFRISVLPALSPLAAPTASSHHSDHLLLFALQPLLDLQLTMSAPSVSPCFTYLWTILRYYTALYCSVL